MKKHIMKKLKKERGNQCEICTYNRCLNSLEFHHTNPENKLFNISNPGKHTIEEIIEEANKCKLLCGNCHREAHEAMFNALVKDNELIITSNPIIEELFIPPIKRKKISERDLCACGNAKTVEASKCRSCSTKDTAAKRNAHLPKIIWPDNETLSKLVWEKPLLEIAKELNTNHQRVGIYCKKQNISIPPLGYWSKGCIANQSN